MIPNRFLEQLKLGLNTAKESIKSIYSNTDETSDKESQVKKTKKNRMDKYSGLFSVGLAITTVAIGIVALATPLGVPFVIAGLAIEATALALKVRDVARKRRKEKNLDKQKDIDEENTLATEESMSDAMSVSSKLSENPIEEKESKLYPVDLLNGLKGDDNDNKRKRKRKFTRREINRSDGNKKPKLS